MPDSPRRVLTVMLFSPRERAIPVPRSPHQFLASGERIVRFGNIIAKNWVQERPQSPRDLLYLVIDGAFMRCSFQALTQDEGIA